MNIKEKITDYFNKKFNSSRPDDSGPSAMIFPFGNFFAGVSYDGEQEPGAYDDTVYINDIDYYTLARRAYTLVTINEFARIAISRFVQFAIGTGLRLHPEPCKRFLKRKFNIKLDDEFAKDIRELWGLFENDKNVSSTRQDNIQSLANLAFINAFIAGDILVVKRIKNKNLEYQLINGLSVQSFQKQNGDNEIKNGVEIDASGKHIAYWVKPEDGGEPVRIKAYDTNGRPIAWLVYASDKRLNAVRGYSPLAAIMQKLRKIGQYANSEVIAADANARFAAVIEHEKESNGLNPLKGKSLIGRSLQNTDNKDGKENNPLIQQEIRKFRESLKKISSGIFFNLPKGQKMSSFDTKRPNVNYTSFLDGSMKYIYASLGIPFEIATLLFSNNFSASRAALKIFELIIEYMRKFCIVDNFYQTIYEQFFELECLKGNIYAPQYLKLKNDLGYMDNAYTKAKFIGQKIPHIDEVKEANAVIAKLRAGLITFEQAIETLGNSVDFDTLIDARKSEEKRIKDAGLIFSAMFAPDDTNDKDNKKEGTEDE